MMSPAILILLAIGLGLAGWLAARSRAWAFQRASRQRLHSLPGYHGWYVALWAAVPALLFAVVWSTIAPQLVIGSVLTDSAAATLPPFGMQRDSVLSEALAVAQGRAAGVFDQGAAALVEPFRSAQRLFGGIGVVATLLLGFAGGAFGFLRLRPDFTARTRVERAVMAVLLSSSSRSSSSIAARAASASGSGPGGPASAGEET